MEDAFSERGISPQHVCYFPFDSFEEQDHIQWHQDLWDRGIAARRDATIRQIYEERSPLYARYADVIVASQQGEDATAQQVEQVMRTVGMSLKD